MRAVSPTAAEIHEANPLASIATNAKAPVEEDRSGQGLALTAGARLVVKPKRRNRNDNAGRVDGRTSS